MNEHHYQHTTYLGKLVDIVHSAAVCFTHYVRAPHVFCAIHFVGKYSLNGIKINYCVKTLFQVGLSFQERVQSLLQKYPSVSSATHVEVRKFYFYLPKCRKFFYDQTKES